MNLSYGLAKTGVSTITNASVQFTEDTDLGIQTNFQNDTNIIPAKGSIATLKSRLDSLRVTTTVTADAVGTTAELDTTSSGAGTGLKVLVSSNGTNINGATIFEDDAGSGYLVGDTVTVAEADMDTDGSIGAVGGDLDLTLTLGNFSATAPTTSGAGYSGGLDGPIICGVSGGTGTGALIRVRTDYGGGQLVQTTGSSVSFIEPTAGFTNFQNGLITGYTGINNPPYSFVRRTSSGANDINGTTAAIATTGGSGTGATVVVTITNGSVTRIVTSGVGSGYKVGDILTVTISDMEAATLTMMGGVGTIVLGDLTMLLNDYNVTGQVVQIVDIPNGGSGYTAGDILTLQEVGSTQTGTATITVETLDTGLTVSTKPNNRYPKAIMISTAGATAAAPAAVTVKDLEGNFVTMQGMLTGVIRPFSFTQVTLSTGETPAIGEVTIYY